jgi:hypothetical protein
MFLVPVRRSLRRCREAEATPEVIEADYSFQSFDGVAALAEEMSNLDNSELLQARSIWMKLEGGKLAHKKTILRIFMDSTSDVDYHISHDCILRVRYFSIGGDNWDRSKLNLYGLLSNGLFCLGSLYATFICIDWNQVSLAILQCTSLKSSAQYIDRVPIVEIFLPDSAYEVSGQILSLLPIFLEQEIPDSPIVSWAWNFQFVALDTAKSRPQKQPQAPIPTRLHHLSFSVNGRLIYPLRSADFKSIQIDKLPPLQGMAQDSSMDATWVITETTIREIEAQLIQHMHNDEGARSKIPLFGKFVKGHSLTQSLLATVSLNSP